MRRSSSCCARAATSRASRPPPSAWPTSTSAATSRSRSSPRGSGTSATVAATPSSTPPSSSAAPRSTSTPRSCAPATPTGSAGSTATGSSRASASSACRSRSGTPSTPTASPTTTTRSCPPRPSSRRPGGQPPGGLHRGPARRARRLRRRPRHLRHLGHLLAHPADRRRVAGADGPSRPLFEKVFPMDVRPQGHDIIRTWLFSTVVRAHFEHGTVPWTTPRSVGLDPRPRPQEDEQVGGNVVTPEALLMEHGADAVRYWAASGRRAPTPPTTPARSRSAGGSPSRCSTRASSRCPSVTWRATSRRR